MGVSLSTLSLTLDVLTPLSQVLACIEWVLETCNVSGIYIYLRDLELCLQITMMSFSEMGQQRSGVISCCMVSIYGYVSSVSVISVKVGGVVWKFLHNPVQRGLPEDAGTDGYGCEFPASIPAVCMHHGLTSFLHQ